VCQQLWFSDILGLLWIVISWLQSSHIL
jgi:hypothetical protein